MLFEKKWMYYYACRIISFSLQLIVFSQNVISFNSQIISVSNNYVLDHVQSDVDGPPFSEFLFATLLRVFLSFCERRKGKMNAVSGINGEIL